MIKAGKYEVYATVEDLGELSRVEIYAKEQSGKEHNITNLNYILSEVIEPVIGEELAMEVEDAVVTTRRNTSKILKNLKNLEGDPYLEKAIDDDLAGGTA